MDDNKVRVVIYGNEYTISGERDSEKIREISKFVDVKMREIGRAFSSNIQGGLGVLTAVNIAAELFDVRQERDSLRERADDAESMSQAFRRKLESSEKDTSKYFESRERMYEEKKLLEDDYRTLEAKYKELENSYFDIQMENVQLKSKVEKLEQESEKRDEDAALADVERRAMEEIKSMGGVKEQIREREGNADLDRESFETSVRKFPDTISELEKRPARRSLLEDFDMGDKKTEESEEKTREEIFTAPSDTFSPFKNPDDSEIKPFDDGFVFGGNKTNEEDSEEESVNSDMQSEINAFDFGFGADSKPIDMNASFDAASFINAKSPLDTLSGGEDNSIFRSLGGEPKSPLEAARVNSGSRLDYKPPIMASQFLRDRQDMTTAEAEDAIEAEPEFADKAASAAEKRTEVHTDAEAEAEIEIETKNGIEAQVNARMEAEAEARARMEAELEARAMREARALREAEMKEKARTLREAGMDATTGLKADELKNKAKGAFEDGFEKVFGKSFEDGFGEDDIE